MILEKAVAFMAESKHYLDLLFEIALGCGFQLVRSQRRTDQPKNLTDCIKINQRYNLLQYID